MSRAVMSSVLSFHGQAKVSRIVVLMVLFGALLGLLQPGTALADTLTAGAPTNIATSPKNATSAFVVMQRYPLSSSNTNDGRVELDNVVIDDNTGTSQYSAVRLYLSSNATTTIPADAVLIGRTPINAVWTGATSTTILLTGGTTTARTVTNAASKYLYVVYDMLYSQTGTTAQSRVRTINVLLSGGTDTGALGLATASNAIFLSATGATANIVDCTGCHGISSLDSATRSAATGSFVGSHNRHVDFKGYTCSACHVNPSTTDHRSKYIDMTSPFLNGGAGGYSKGTVSFPQVSNPVPGTCSTIYCHSNGAGTTSTATWGGTMPADCTGCHGNNNASAVVMGTEHPNHLNSSLTGRSFVCADCHNATITSTTDRLIANQANHVSGRVNVKFNPAGVNLDTDGPTYGGQSTSVVNGATVTGGIYYSCNNVYCHSTGNLSTTTLLVPVAGLSTFKTPTWQGAALGCADCHGDTVDSYPKYATGSAGSGTANSHAKHVASSAIGCAYCHVQTTGTDTTTDPVTLPSGTRHLNRIEDVTFLPASGASATYVRATKTCNTTYCHGGGNPQWGGAALNCDSCHYSSSNLSSGATNSNRHSMHYETTTAATTISTANSATAGSYVFGCGNCHDLAQISHGTGANNVRFNIAISPVGTGGTYTAGGSVLTDTRNFSYSQNGSCSSIYCHSNGAPRNATASYKTVTWNQAAGTGVNQCSVCHNGLAASTTPIDTNKHTFHINAATYNFSCNECHWGTTTTGTTIANKVNHVDGTKDVIWRSGGSNSDGTAYGSGPNCNNIYCHSNGQSATQPYVLSGTAVTWNVTQTLSCAGCHNYVAPSTTLSSGAHAAHLNTSIPAGAITCRMCHNATTTDNVNITTFANHVNKNINVQFISNASGTVGSTYAGSAAQSPSVASKAVGLAAGTCNTTLCHGGNSQTWTATNPGVATCVKCHGVAGSLTASYGGDPLRAAPGYVTAGSPTGVNTSGTFTFTDAKVGAHDAHLRGTNGYKPGGVGCDDCHAVGSLTSSGHMNGSTTFVWSNLARNIGTTYNTTYSVPIVTPTYGVAGAGACATNYCHGGAFGGTAGLVGTDVTPTWNVPGWLANPASSMVKADCDKCHISPPLYAGKYDHSSVTFGPGACNACHQHDGNGPAHIDGVLYGAGTCDSCHSYDVDINGDWGYSPKAVEGWGAHATHIRHLRTVTGVTLSASADQFGGAVYAQVCGVCHSVTNNSAIHSMGGQTNVRQVNFADGSLAYQFSSLSGAPTYSGVTGTSSQFVAKTCSNVSCHYQATPVWQGF